MGHAIPRQHPAVVLRSHFNRLRALLAVTLVAVAGLTVAVVILSNDADEVSTSSAQPIESINYGGSKYVNPSTGLPAALLPQLEQSLQNRIDGTRSDGGPEEGTRGIDLASQASPSSAVATKDEARTAAAIGHPGSGTESNSSKGSEFGTSQYRFAQPQTGAPVQPQTGTTAQP
jgi:hypothetical protein